jgi:hypothetical protein
MFLPGLIGALVILLTGYLVAKQLERWTDKTLQRLEFKRMVADGGFADAVNRGRVDPVNAVGRLVFWLMMLVVILFASSALGLENIRDMFGRMIAFIPTLISGIIIIILGIIIGEFVQGVILASAGGVSGVPTLAKLTKGIMVLIALFMALQQVGVAEEIVTSAFHADSGLSRAGGWTRVWPGQPGPRPGRSRGSGTRRVCGGIGGSRIRLRGCLQIRWESLLPLGRKP